MMRRIERENTGLLHPGQDLVVAGYAGLAGTLKLVETKKEELSHWFSGEYMDEIAECSQYLVPVTAESAQETAGLAEVAAQLAGTSAVQKQDLEPETAYDGTFWKSLGATEWEPAGEGGILTAIWNLTGAYETGVEFYLRQIPIRQETVEVCERLELNPYRLYSQGCILLTAENGGQLVRALAEKNIPAQVIGRVIHKRDACERGFVQRDQQLAARAVRERDVLQLCQRAQLGQVRHVCAVETQLAHVQAAAEPGQVQS